MMLLWENPQLMSWREQSSWRRGCRPGAGGTILSNSGNHQTVNSDLWSVIVVQCCHHIKPDHSFRLNTLLIMDSVRKAQARLSSYPLHLASCGPEAASYGRCVGEHLGEVRRDQCLAQWTSFITCVRNSAKKMGTRLWILSLDWSMNVNSELWLVNHYQYWALIGGARNTFVNM